METKCAAFWHHTNIRSDNRVFPCCRFKDPVDTFDGDVSPILFSNSYENLREQSNNNVPIAGCEKCYYEESLGKESLRQKFNKEYDTETVSLEFLEIGFDNICNLTCDGCWAEFSSAWSIKLNPDAPKNSHIRSIEDITDLPPTINKILFLGGEPLMTNRHKRLLKMVANPAFTEVVYNTNGTFMLTIDVIELLRKFKSVEFIVSIDGFGKLNEQVRQGSNWSDIIEFLTQLRQLDFKTTIHTVIHRNNWHGLKDLESMIRHLGVDWTTNVLTYPKHLDIITVEDRAACKNLIAELNIPNKEYILKHLDKE
jgi:sulfatase maturation enzyme AslB (radical SAM superfamily)